MVEERITDGTRIAQLLASEVEGRTDGPLGRLAIADADPEVDPTADGARAYDVVLTESDGIGPLATVYVHPDRARLAFETESDAAREVADADGLRTGGPSTDGPGLEVVVEYGAAAKAAADVLAAAVDGSDVTIG